MLKVDEATLNNEIHEEIEKIQAGDMDAFRSFVERNRERIYYLARDLTGNHHDAEDLSQDVFIKAYQSISKFRKEAKVQTWLYRITVNAFIDKKRKKVLNIVSLTPDNEKSKKTPEPMEEGVNGSPERYVDSGIIQKSIQKALEQLAPKEKSVFVLKHYKHLTIKEISSTLKIAEGTVKSLLFRAVQKMQKHLSFFKKDLGLEDC
ncbi:MAG: RNA polymerase sigma factor [Calditrichia bacterium]|nr:RNA polymerase sigma factor [Calditrichia bacterium]